MLSVVAPSALVEGRVSMDKILKPSFPESSLMNKCKTCGNDIKITIYRGLGYCCENHRKILMEEK